MHGEASFPQCRRLRNGRVFYRIDGPTRMTEIQWIGQRRMEHTVQAQILPERLLISDLVTNEGNRWEVIAEEEFLAAMEAPPTL